MKYQFKIYITFLLLNVALILNAQAILQTNLQLNPDGQYVLTQQITNKLKAI